MKQSTTQSGPSVESSTPLSGDSTALRTFLVGVALLTISSVGGLFIIQGFSYLQILMGSDSFTLIFLIGGGLATLWFGLVGVAYLRLRPVTVHYGLRWPTLRDTRWIIGGVIGVVLVSLLIEIIVGVFRDGNATTISSAAAVENPVLIYTIFLIGNLVFIAPIEEFLFRGIVQGRLRESFGALTAISITSIGFALGHIPSYWFGGSDLFSISVGGALLGIGATGFILGAIYERTENLLLVSIIHGVVNSIGIAIALAALL